MVRVSPLKRCPHHDAIVSAGTSTVTLPATLTGDVVNNITLQLRGLWGQVFDS